MRRGVSRRRWIIVVRLSLGLSGLTPLCCSGLCLAMVDEAGFEVLPVGRRCSSKPMCALELASVGCGEERHEIVAPSFARSTLPS